MGPAGRKSSHIRCETTSNTPGIQTARLFQNGPTVSPICPSVRRPTTPTPKIRRKAETLDRSDVTSERGGLRYVTHDTNEQQEEISTEERGEREGNRTCGQKGSPLPRGRGLETVRGAHPLAERTNEAGSRSDLDHRDSPGVRGPILGSDDSASWLAAEEGEGGRARELLPFS